jgi:sugar-specific transcriptional regulator TrmB
MTKQFVIFTSFLRNIVVQGVLKNIGFSTNEASVYLALLNLGKGTAIETAKEAGMSRTTAFDVLKSLVRKGVVVENALKGRRTFAIENVDMLYSFLERKEAEIKKGKEAVSHIRIELESLRYPQKSIPKVRLYEGEKEIQKLFQGMLTEGKGLPLSLICTKEFMDNYGSFLDRFEPLRTKGETELKLLIHDQAIHPKKPKHKKSALLEIRTLKEKERYNAAMHLFGNTVGFWSFKKTLVLVLMESEEITHMHANVFEALWNQAK